MTNMNETRLYQKVQYSIDIYHMGEDYRRIKENFAIAAGIYREFIAVLKEKNVNMQFPIQTDRLFEVLQASETVGVQVQSGAIFITEGKEKVVEVPVQEVQTKRLIHLFAN